MRKNDLKKTAYERYQLRWMIEHGKSLEDLRNELIANEEMLREDGNPKVRVCETWEVFEETGFNNELYSDYSEFLSQEFQDIDYMKSILDKEEFAIWKTIRFSSETDTFVEFSVTGDYSVHTLYVPDYTTFETADISQLIEYTLHAILDNGGSGRDVKNIIGFRKVTPEEFEIAAEGDYEVTITDLCYLADGLIDNIWKER
jgi:hypothetical protein